MARDSRRCSHHQPAHHPHPAQHFGLASAVVLVALASDLADSVVVVVVAAAAEATVWGDSHHTDMLRHRPGKDPVLKQGRTHQIHARYHSVVPRGVDYAVVAEA